MIVLSEEIRKIKPKHKYSLVIMQMLIRKGNTNKNPFNFAISGRDPAGHDSWVAMGKRNETDSKQNGKGDSLFSYSTVVLWIYGWTWIVKVHQVCIQIFNRF